MPNKLYPIALYDRHRSYISAEDGATVGATLEVNLYHADGTIVPTSFVDATAAIAAHVAAGDPHPQYLTAAEADALFTTPAEVAASYVAKAGDTMTGELRNTSANAYRMVQGNYGAFWRQDGSSLFLLLTASGDQYGSWNALRPFAVNVATGAVSVGTALAASSTVSVTGALNTLSTLAVGGGSIGFSAQQTIHSPTGTQCFLNLWQAGIGTGGIGFLASNSNMRIVNSYVDGTLAGGNGMEIEPNGRIGVGGIPGTSNFERLKVYGGITTTGTESSVIIADRTTSRLWNLYSSTDLFRLYNGSSDVLNVTAAGALTTVGNITGNNLRVGSWGGGAAYGGIYHTQMSSTEYMIISGGSTDNSTYISTLAGAGGMIHIRPSGNVGTYATIFTTTGIQSQTPYQRIAADASAYVSLPRIFVQAGDPGVAAADGDLWFW